MHGRCFLLVGGELGALSFASDRQFCHFPTLLVIPADHFAFGWNDGGTSAVAAPHDGLAVDETVKRSVPPSRAKLSGSHARFDGLPLTVSAWT